MANLSRRNELRDEKAICPVMIRAEPDSAATRTTGGQLRSRTAPLRIAHKERFGLIRTFCVKQRTGNVDQSSAGLHQCGGNIDQA